MNGMNAVLPKMDKSIALSMLRCPQCGATLRLAPAEYRVFCNNENGVCNAGQGFPLIDGQPALVVFERSVLNESALVANAGGSPIHRRKPGGFLRNTLRKTYSVLHGGNRVAGPNCRRFLSELAKMSSQPIVLNVGGGNRRAGNRSPACEGRHGSTPVLRHLLVARDRLHRRRPRHPAARRLGRRRLDSSGSGTRHRP